MKLEDYLIPTQGHISASQVRAVIPEDAPFLIVLDDDPTGSQSVADLPILTSWEVDDFLWAFSQKKPAIYVITNTRSLDAQTARELVKDIVSKANEAATQASVKLSFVSRSDSTLRSQFPVEVQAIQEALGKQADGIILLPAFPDAGRVTVNGVHYAQEMSGQYVQVATTDFAQDKTFGYEQSFLPKWVEEKTDGAVPNADVQVVTLEALRTEPYSVYEMLARAEKEQIFAVDCITEADMRAIAITLSELENTSETDPDVQPKSFIYQVGPPFVRARIGQEVAPPLEPADIHDAFPTRNPGGGLIVVGSHVQLTSRQLAHLRGMYPDAVPLEVTANKIVDVAQLGVELTDEQASDVAALRTMMAHPNAKEHVNDLVEQAVSAMEHNHVILHTSRTLVAGQHELQSLVISNLIAQAVVDIEQGIIARRKPNFLIAKGGITSSDMASRGMQMRRGRIIGPLGEGIISLIEPIDGPCAQIPFVIFAGNVGKEDSLTYVVQQLMR